MHIEIGRVGHVGASAHAHGARPLNRTCAPTTAAEGARGGASEKCDRVARIQALVDKRTQRHTVFQQPDHLL